MRITEKFRVADVPKLVKKNIFKNVFFWYKKVILSISELIKKLFITMLDSGMVIY
jgi:hypothetical protein